MTPNPSIDRTIEIGRLERGALIRASRSSAEAAGKGINVSCALTAEGVATMAVLPLAADSATAYLRLLADATATVAVPTAGSIRINVSLVEGDGTVTKVNEPGPALSAAEVDAILSAAAAIPNAAWILGCGSLPPGVPVDFYARLTALRSPDRRVAVDTSGDALSAAVSAGVALIKPNRIELEQLVGCTLSTIGDVAGAARTLVDRGCDAVLVSLGADGALHVDADVAVHAEAAIDDIINTVGAGDALLAGFVASGGGHAGLATAIAWSVAAVRSRGTRMRKVTAADRASVIVHERLDPARRLQG